MTSGRPDLSPGPWGPDAPGSALGKSPLTGRRGALSWSLVTGLKGCYTWPKVSPQVSEGSQQAGLGAGSCGNLGIHPPPPAPGARSPQTVPRMICATAWGARSLSKEGRAASRSSVGALQVFVCCFVLLFLRCWLPPTLGPRGLLPRGGGEVKENACTRRPVAMRLTSGRFKIENCFVSWLLY